MDARRFDTLTKSLSARLTRRGGFGLLGALGVVAEGVPIERFGRG